MCTTYVPHGSVMQSGPSARKPSVLWRPKDRGAADTMGSACSPWVTLADPGGGGWDGSCWHLAPCMSASPLGAFPRSAPDLALGVPPPLVPSFSPSLLRPVPRGGARLSLPDRELSVFGRGLRQACGDSPAPRLHRRQSRRVDKTRQGTRPSVWGVGTLLHRSLTPASSRAPRRAPCTALSQP